MCAVMRCPARLLSKYPSFEALYRIVTYLIDICCSESSYSEMGLLLVILSVILLSQGEVTSGMLAEPIVVTKLRRPFPPPFAIMNIDSGSGFPGIHLLIFEGSLK